MKAKLSGIRQRVERLAAEREHEEPEPDPRDDIACLIWAVNRYGLAQLLMSERA